MINEIKEKIKLNEKVYIELVDPNGLRGRGDFQEGLIQDLLDSDKLQVLDAGLGIHDNLVKVRLHNSCRAILIDEENLVFFEMVSEGATFDDLVDVIAKALKDGVEFGSVGFFRGGLLFGEFYDDTIKPSDKYGIKKAIEWIESLYTETFVIEHQSDLSKIKLNDKKTKVELANGTLVSDEVWDILKDQSGKTQLSILKGATVTQRKTNN